MILMLFSKEWVHWNEHLPTADDVIIAYKLLYDDNDITDEQENILNWFIMTVIPVVHVASRTKFNWCPLAFRSGVPPLYSTFVTTSNEAFALFLLEHYRNPPPPKEEKSKKSVTPVKVEKKKKNVAAKKRKKPKKVKRIVTKTETNRKTKMTTMRMRRRRKSKTKNKTKTRSKNVHIRKKSTSNREKRTTRNGWAN